MLGCVDPDHLKIEEAQLLKITNLPKLLYKFRCVNKKSLNNLENGTVWLNSPSKYGDPFECCEYIDFHKVENIQNSIHKDEYIKQLSEDINIPIDICNNAKSKENPIMYLLKYWLKEVEGESDEAIDKVKEAIENSFLKNTTEMMVENNRAMQDTMKMCSFCESPYNILMWSHYANQHKGFCIEYDLSKFDNTDIRKRILYPVIYKNNLFDSTQHFIQLMKNKKFNNLYHIISCSTKSTLWRYEKEWRMIFNIGPSFQEQNYNMDCQSKVFLGIRISDEDKEDIIEICKNKKIVRV